MELAICGQRRIFIDTHWGGVVRPDRLLAFQRLCVMSSELPYEFY